LLAFEMAVETAGGQPDLRHHIGDADRLDAALPEEPRGCRDGAPAGTGSLFTRPSHRVLPWRASPCAQGPPAAKPAHPSNRARTACGRRGRKLRPGHTFAVRRPNP